jgi:NAD(P)-dependent dehydrogenase (short-subunit alcohol dehydrogenase family)
VKGQVALVTGASRGIGRATALALAAAGVHVVLTARSQGGLEETDDLIRTAGGSATLLPLDLIKEADKIDLLGPSLVQRFGRLDVLVHAAGLLAKLTPAAHIPPRDWSESLAVNATAAYRLIRACDPPLRAAPAGRAIFLHDSHATEPTPYWSLYSTAKAAQAHLVQCWATELTMTPLRVALEKEKKMKPTIEEMEAARIAFDNYMFDATLQNSIFLDDYRDTIRAALQQAIEIARGENE